VFFPEALLAILFQVIGRRVKRAERMQQRYLAAVQVYEETVAAAEAEEKRNFRAQVSVPLTSASGAAVGQNATTAMAAAPPQNAPSQNRIKLTVRERLEIDNKSDFREFDRHSRSARRPMPTGPVLSDDVVTATTCQRRMMADRHLRRFFISIPYFLAALCCALSVYYILIFGVRFENQESLDWLRANIVSMIITFFAIQPLMIFLRASLCVLVMKQRVRVRSSAAAAVAAAEVRTWPCAAAWA
jgi:hypothetical protein